MVAPDPKAPNRITTPTLKLLCKFIGLSLRGDKRRAIIVDDVK
jgi:hypothetical protein